MLVFRMSETDWLVGLIDPMKSYARLHAICRYAIELLGDTRHAQWGR